MMRFQMVVLALVLCGICGAPGSSVHAITCPTDLECVESPFGWREVIPGHFHNGWDIIRSTSNDVVSVAEGTVDFEGIWEGYDGTVVINHGDYWVGYHDLTQATDFDQGDYVPEGTVVGTVSPRGHCHINIWDEAGPGPPNDPDGNTVHPGRILDEYGYNNVYVGFSHPPVCWLTVVGEGDVLKVGVGKAESAYGFPYWTYVWDYENNVRASYAWDPAPPGTFHPPSEPVFIDTPSNWDACSSRHMHFGFWCDSSDWIVDDYQYTFLEVGDGTVYFIEQPIGEFLGSVNLESRAGDIVVSWRFNPPTNEVGGAEANYYFRVQRTCDYSEYSDWSTPPITYSGNRMAFVDEDPCDGSCYRVECVSRASNTVVEEFTVCVDAVVKESAGNIVAYPNPANGSSSLSYTKSLQGGPARMMIYDVRGRAIKEMVLDNRKSGMMAWNLKDNKGRDVPSGLYTACLHEDGMVTAKARITVVK